MHLLKLSNFFKGMAMNAVANTLTTGGGLLPLNSYTPGVQSPSECSPALQTPVTKYQVVFGLYNAASGHNACPCGTFLGSPIQA